MEISKLYDICSLGSASNDITMLVSRFPVEGETLQALEVHHANGGKGANTIVAASRLSSKAIFAGQVGSDSGADKIIKEMNDAGVNTLSLRKIPEVQTGLALIFLNPKKENSIVIVGGANIFYKNIDILPDEYQKAIRESSILMLQREITQEINVLAAIYAQKNNTLVVLDYGGRDEPMDNVLLENIDFLSPNQTELERVFKCIGIDSLEQLFKKYPKMRILLKLGSKGSSYQTIKAIIDQPSSTIINPDILNEYSIVDTTGAGDCFTAAFFVRYKELIYTGHSKPNIDDDINKENELKKCLAFANSAGFLAITKMGAMTSMPLRNNLDNLMKKYLEKYV